MKTSTPTETPLLSIQQDGRKAEIVINTGHTLRNGQSWRAYAKVFCPNVYTAGLVAENLRRLLAEAVADARKDAYEEGYRHALESQPRRERFSGVL